MTRHVRFYRDLTFYRTLMRILLAPPIALIAIAVGLIATLGVGAMAALVLAALILMAKGGGFPPPAPAQ